MKNQYPNLDFIRTVAVLSVVVRHVLGELGVEAVWFLRVQFLGIFGVMLFFVLTAHVLMLSLSRMCMVCDKHVFKSFLIQRIFRIYPLSVAVVLAGWLVSLYADAPWFHVRNIGDLFANLLLVQNVVGAPDAIGPLWSLPLEVQMYIFLPFVFIFLIKNKFFALWLYGMSILLAFLAFKFNFPDVFRFFPCFFPGIIAFWLMYFCYSRKVLPFFVLPFFLAAGALLYFVTGEFSQTVGAYPVCLGVGLVIPFVRESDNQFLNAVCGVVAKYSYGIYLVHAPILAMLFELPLSPIVAVCLFFLLTTFFSVICNMVIETPMIEFGKKVVCKFVERD